VPSITGINLVRIDESDNLTEDHTIESGETMDLDSFVGAVIAFSAVSSDPDATGSVLLSIDTSTPISQIDDSVPYLLGGDSHFDVDAGALTASTYTLTATPYSEANGAGDAGEDYSVSFTIDAIDPDTSGNGWLLYNGIIPSGYHDKYPKDSEYAISGPLNPTLRDFRIRIEGLTIEDGVSITQCKFQPKPHLPH
jgi:hypothetical protein